MRHPSFVYHSSRSSQDRIIDNVEVHMQRVKSLTFAILVPSLIILCGCDDLVPHDTQSLIDPHLRRSEVVGILAGFGTTFAAMPDLIAMLKRQSSAGMNPRMATIMAVFQILWVYYGLLISSRPVVIWNVIAVLVNSLSVGAYFHFLTKKKCIAKPGFEQHWRFFCFRETMSESRSHEIQKTS